MSSHLDFTLVQKPLFLFFPSSSSLPFFLAALSQQRMGFLNMLGVYVVMGCGIVAAFITLIAEIYWKKMTKKQETKLSWFKGTRLFILIKVRPSGKSSLVSVLFWVGNVKPMILTVMFGRVFLAC